MSFMSFSLFRFLLFAVLIAGVLGGGFAASAAELKTQESRMIGLGISINDPPNAIALAKLVGAGAIRVDAPWSQIERVPGAYVIPDWLERTVDSMVSAGVTPLLILAYGNSLYDGGDKPRSRAAVQAFAKYSEFVVKHFKGRVLYYDLWNEWDAHTGRTTPLGADEYVALAQVVYPAIKAIDPKVQVLSGGISDKGMREGFFERFFQLQGHRYIDGLSIHPYVWNSRKRRTPEGAMEFVDQVANQARGANNGADIPLYLTEVGWPTHSGKYAVSEEEAAWFLSRYLILAASRNYVRGVFWYCLMDQGADPANKEHRFGILDRSQQARPAAKELKKITEILKGNARVIVRQDGKQSIANVSNAGVLSGQFTWEEEPDSNTKSDARAPKWQAAVRGAKVP